MSIKNISVKRTLVIPDTHFQSPVNGGLISPDFCHDPNVISLMLQVMKDLKPDEVIHLGDICEMGTVSEWAKSVNRESQIKGNDGEWYKSTWKEQMNMVESFWRYIHKVVPNSKKHQLEGNHDFWCDLSFSKPPLSQFPELTMRNWNVWKELGISYYRYDGDQKKEQPWVDVGKVRVLHGYKNVSAQRVRLEHDNSVYGHQHKILYNSWDASSRETRRSWCIGCLTKLKPDYNSRGGAQNGWAQAFAIIYTMPDGNFNVRVVEITNGIIVDFNGKTYYPKVLSDIDKSLKVLELPQ
jgi:predicted phosphodiesterase